MAQDYVKRFVTKDGNTRINIYYDSDADNPRYNTDEPFHCEDWSNEYSIMNKQERENKSSNAAALLRYLLHRHGDNKKIIKALKDNYKSERHDAYDNALSYDRSRKEWILWSWQPYWKDYHGNVYDAHWAEEWAFCINIYDVDLYNIVDILSDEQIDTLCDEKYWTDGVKIGSYSFGYHGTISFDDSFSTDSEGLCWLEKEEFLKYSGCDEKYWKGKTLTEIEWLTDELEAWGEGDVYGFVVENRIEYKVHKEYTNVERDDEDYEEVEWEDEGLNSCWGFYGKLDDEHIGYILESAGYKKEELDEVA